MPTWSARGNGSQWSQQEWDAWYASLSSSSSSWQGGAHSGWICSLCSTQNQPRGKACKTCRAVRTYAEVAAGQGVPPAPPGSLVQPSPGQVLQSQLAQVSGLIDQAKHGSQPLAVNAPSGSHQTMEVETTNNQDDRQALVTQLQQLEASLAQIPDAPGLADVRETIMTKHALVKQRLSEVRPLGARLDGCRAALTRARARCKVATEAVSAAIAAQEEAQRQVVQYETQLRELEATVATAQPEQVDGSNSIERLQGDMERILREMAHGGQVPGEEVQGVMAQMTTLFQQVTTIASRVSQQTAAQTPTLASSTQAGGEALNADTAIGNSDRAEQQRLLQLLQNNARSQEPHAAAAVGGA